MFISQTLEELKYNFSLKKKNRTSKYGDGAFQDPDLCATHPSQKSESIVRSEEGGRNYRKLWL